MHFKEGARSWGLVVSEGVAGRPDLFFGPPRAQRISRIIKALIFGRTRLGGEFTLILDTEVSEISEDFGGK